MTASTFTEMAFAFQGSSAHPELRFSSIQGHTSHYAEFPAGGFFKLFGVSLYSHSVPVLFQLPASELCHRFLPIDSLCGNAGDGLIERIALAASTAERVQVLTSFFKAQLLRSSSLDTRIAGAVKHIRQQRGNVNIADLAGQCGFSKKQFERRFLAGSGFSPKLFARIVRFENAMRSYPEYPDLTSLAYASGYYDQAHFIRDFNAFSGYSPAKFFALSGY